MTFENLNLDPKILKGVTGAGYSQPTKIQLEAIPKILEGRDLRASAQTGTGKTAAFLLPALHRLTHFPQLSGKGPRILVLVPTRELGMQIAVQAEKYSKHLSRVTTVCIGGGVPYHKQLGKLSRPYEILIATPGRLIDFLEQRKISLSRVEMLVLDEADRMLDMGFIDPVEEIVSHTPSTRQTLLFSATLKGPVVKLSEKLLNNPEEIVIHAEKAKHESITQKVHFVEGLDHKNRLLDHFLNQKEVQYAIVFTSTKRHADQLVDELDEKGFLAEALHGDMNQRQRTRTIQRFREGQFRVLVATDVAARGIDVQSVTHVINFDLPHNIEDYVHRIGRTGRAGSMGTALSFVSERDSSLMKKIEHFTGQSVDIIEIPGFECRSPKQNKKPFKKRPFDRKKKGQFKFSGRRSSPHSKPFSKGQKRGK